MRKRLVASSAESNVSKLILATIFCFVLLVLQLYMFVSVHSKRIYYIKCTRVQRTRCAALIQAKSHTRNTYLIQLVHKWLMNGVMSSSRNVNEGKFKQQTRMMWRKIKLNKNNMPIIILEYMHCMQSA